MRGGGRLRAEPGTQSGRRRARPVRLRRHRRRQHVGRPVPHLVAAGRHGPSGRGLGAVPDRLVRDPAVQEVEAGAEPGQVALYRRGRGPDQVPEPGPRHRRAGRAPHHGPADRAQRPEMGPRQAVLQGPDLRPRAEEVRRVHALPEGARSPLRARRDLLG